MEKQIIKLWVFWYNGMVYESSSYPMSYHRTKKGAIAAMKAHKDAERKEFDRMYANEKEWKPKFGEFEHWSVNKFELIIED